MPVTAGLRDEENERINNILKKLIALDYVPENGNDMLNDELKNLAMDVASLSAFTPKEMTAHLQKLHFDWANAEQFADFLVGLSAKTENLKLKENAIAVYNYIQLESKIFSFDIFNKIAALKASLS